MNRPRWFDRRISAPGPHLCLCLTERDYTAAMRHVGASADARGSAPAGPRHGSPSAMGWQADRGDLLERLAGRNPVEVAGLLVHEAVHAWQEWCDFMASVRLALNRRPMPFSPSPRS